MTTHTPLQFCLNCGKELDAASAVVKPGTCKTEPKPGRGDFSICISCGHLMVFTRGLSLRNPTKAELRAAEKSELVRGATWAIGKTREQFSGKKPQ